ncbi:hypothetical protein TNCV_624861 [Trichonephila clavipes]|nr:hypothetical protein TNCV_624861 [Trichonephila clavipes]
MSYHLGFLKELIDISRVCPGYARLGSSSGKRAHHSIRSTVSGSTYWLIGAPRRTIHCLIAAVFDGCDPEPTLNELCEMTPGTDDCLEYR